jgi:hypothetical protein
MWQIYEMKAVALTRGYLTDAGSENGTRSKKVNREKTAEAIVPRTIREGQNERRTPEDERHGGLR